MGLYSRYLFPRILDWTLRTAQVREERCKTLSSLTGNVLEIGFGTGLNLACYPRDISKLTTIDNETLLPERVARRIARVQFPVEQLKLDAGGRLPFEDKTFDGVASTFTLCSIADVTSALGEIRRVLKPAGQFVFLEHGRSDDFRVAKRQDFFNPVQKLVGRGCHMNRKIDTLISSAGLQIVSLDRFVMKDTPRVLGEMYRGVAGKG